MKTLKAFTNPNDVKFLNVITVRGNEWNRFTAFLPYKRDFDRGRYQVNGSCMLDQFDQELMYAIEEVYPDSTFHSETLLFEGQEEERIKALKGGVDLDFQVTLFPIFPNIEDYLKNPKKEYIAVTKDFKLLVHLGPTSERLGLISPYVVCNLEPEIINEKKDTIHSVK